LFTALDREDMAENEYVMKAIMRLISFGKELLMPHIELCMGKVSNRRPSTPSASTCAHVKSRSLN